jgi:hypothetical protein
MGGSQQQLDAMIAETTVPIFAIESARPDVFLVSSAAPGGVVGLGVQQSGFG